MKKRLYFYSFIICLMPTMLFLTSNLLGQNMIPEAANTSRYVGKGRWDWTVYINAPEEILDNIRQVEYHLHPTFPNPIHTVNELGDPRYPFGLRANGWGVFQISIKIIYKTGKTTELKHMLKFESQEVEQPLSIEAGNVASSSSKGLWKWTIFIRGPEKDLAKIQLVEYTLHPDIPNNIQEVLERGSGVRAFPLSGKSSRPFEVKLRVFLKNGRVQYLNHILRF